MIILIIIDNYNLKNNGNLKSESLP